MSIIMLHGLPCTGKSVLAGKIAESFPNTVHLKSVQFRLNVNNSSSSRFDETIPDTRREKDKTYRLLCNAAKKAFTSGKTPILDATFHKRHRRQWAYDLAREMQARIAVVSLVADESTILERLKSRESQNSRDAFLKSKEAYFVMKQQADKFLDEDVPIFIADTTKLRFEELEKWLKNTLS